MTQGTKIEFGIINAALNADTVVPTWLPDGKRQGREWVARNPNRNDKNAGSFSVNLSTGKWADFAAGDEANGGDLVSLYAYLFHRGDQGAAARDLAESNGIRIDTEARQQYADNKVDSIADAQPRPVIPAPPGVPACDPTHYRFGKPVASWTYRNADGAVMLHVARYEPEGMRKQLVPWSWCEKPEGYAMWMARGVTGDMKRPLYGLDRLNANPDADVIVVEGEKTADAAQALFGESAVCVAWLGGSATAGKVDCKPLKGRNVTLWPDFDAERERLTVDEKDAGVDPSTKPLLALHEQPGFKAMMTLALVLKAHAKVQMVGYTPGEFEHGFDLADGWDAATARAYLAKHCATPEEVAAGKLLKKDPAKPKQHTPLNVEVNIHGFPNKGPKGQNLSTIENIAYIMQCYGITARYNEVRKAVELSVPGVQYHEDAEQESALTRLSSLCSLNNMPKGDLDRYVKGLASDDAYSPVRDWIESRPWDGVQRIGLLQDTIKTGGDDTLKNALIYRWLISAVAAAWRHPDFESHGALVFTGAQGKGKTTWFRRLAPTTLGVVLIGASVDPADKDSVTQVVSHWIVELGELDATFRRADIARLKAFITRPSDKMRRPYDRTESNYKRGTIFGGSVNKNRYLEDETGNRRWWTIKAEEIDHRHGIDMQQLWAEVVVHYKRGEQWWLTEEENDALNEVNKEHEAIDPIRERLMTAFDFESTARDKEMTATDVLLAIGEDRATKATATHMSELLRELVGEPRRTSVSRLFRMPYRKSRDRHEHGDGHGPF
ncbi:VapE domain-containing protein [Dyella sp. 2RAF44]|uniref:VapE domain-containing protein n=1 Tax=Dyella sp. 2RAF44 TaxID=3233000 RepID=UPI003F8FE424